MLNRWNSRRLVLCTIAVAGLVFVGKWLYKVNFQMMAEYTTATVIRNVTKFVDSHDGRWPRDWEEVGGGDFARQYVRIDFGVSVERLLKDREQIYRSIIPVTDVYHTYPHAKRDLDRLWDVLAKHHPQARDQEGSSHEK